MPRKATRTASKTPSKEKSSRKREPAPSDTERPAPNEPVRPQPPPELRQHATPERRRAPDRDTENANRWVKQRASTRGMDRFQAHGHARGR
jgi:hypothetical protein